MRSLTLATSGQNNLNSPRAQRDPKIDPNCELCGVKQNSKHVLINCPHLDHIKHSIEYEDIESNIYDKKDTLDLTKFTKLVKKSGLFK